MELTTTDTAIEAQEAEITELGKLVQDTAAATTGMSIKLQQQAPAARLDDKYLEGNEQLKELMSSEVFKQYQGLLEKQFIDMATYNIKNDQRPEKKQPKPEKGSSGSVVFRGG